MVKRVPLLDGGEVWFATSTVRWGAMGSSRGLAPNGIRRRSDFITRVLKANPSRQVAAGLAHQNVIEDVAGLSSPFYEGRDGLCTLLPNISLVITHKDCVPIFLWGSGNQGDMVGMLHAGWRGVLGAMEGGAILPKAIQFVRTRYGIAPSELSVFLGPALQQCHFEVRDDVAEAFLKYYPNYASQMGPASCFVSLHEILMAQAQEAGVSFVKRNDECTYHEMRLGKYVYFSHRRETHERGKADQNASVPADGKVMISAIVRTQEERK